MAALIDRSQADGISPPAVTSRVETTPERLAVDRQSLILAVVVMGVLVVGLVVSAAGRATMPFGDSHDGQNAGVWAGNSRSLREQGVVASRLGTVATVEGEAVTYATHPPMIAVEAAAAEAVLGERPWVARLPAWAGSLAALVLGFLLLRECRLRPLAAAVGVALGFGCPMFAAYGTMLDTPIVGLPFGIAVLWLWQRGRSGRPAPTAIVILVTVLAALTSWLGLLTVGLVAAGSLVLRVRRRLERGADRPRSADDIPLAGFVAGAVLGGALVLLWILWAYGSWGPLASQFLIRAGDRDGGGGLATFIGAQRTYWPRAFTPWQLVLAIPALVAGVGWRPSRAVALVAVLAVSGWVGGFRDGAIMHDYWAYWMVLPLALGFGVLAEASLAALQRSDAETGLPPRPSTSSPRASRVSLARTALAGCSAALALAGVVAPSGAGTTLELGGDAGSLLAVAAYPSSQRQAWVMMAGSEDFRWVHYATDRPMQAIRPADLDGIAATELVLAAVSSGPPAGNVASAPCLPAPSVQGRYALVTAADLARALRVGCTSPAA